MTKLKNLMELKDKRKEEERGAREVITAIKQIEVLVKITRHNHQDLIIINPLEKPLVFIVIMN